MPWASGAPVLENSSAASNCSSTSLVLSTSAMYSTTKYLKEIKQLPFQGKYQLYDFKKTSPKTWIFLQRFVNTSSHHTVHNSFLFRVTLGGLFVTFKGFVILFQAQMSPSLMNIRLYTVFKNLQQCFSIDLRHIKCTINHCKERGKKSSQTGGFVLKT